MELRTYDVPKGTASSLMTTMKDVLWMGDNRQNVGRAVVTPDGRLLVLATPSVQAGVQSLVDEVTKHPPTTDQTVELHYFLVLAKPGSAPYPAGANEIKPALDEIVHSQGPQSFTLVSRAGLSSLHDEEARLDNFGEKLEIRQFAVQTAEGVYAKLSIRSNEDKLETRIHLAADKYVVLGTAGHSVEGAEGATLYYVVRVAPR